MTIREIYLEATKQLVEFNTDPHIVEQGKDLIKKLSKEVTTADEMFAKLGYRKVIDEKFGILYESIDGSEKHRIHFHYACDSFAVDGTITTYITMPLNKAIQQKLKELGLLD